MRKLIFFALVFVFGCAGQEETGRPDIILINIDDMGWRDAGFMGSEFYETPVLDLLASEGMIFEHAYAAASNCAPSRASMMSGQWTPRHGIYTVGSSERGKSKNRRLIPTPNKTVLGDEQYILPEALKDAGYTTCHAGKWHLSSDPTSQGFDVNIGGCEAGNPGSYYPPYKNVPLEAPSDDYYLTNLVMDKTIDFVLSLEARESLFLYYSPYAVHTPIHPVKELLPLYENKEAWNGQSNIKYATMIDNLDTQIGRLIASLEEAGRLENTFILFTSDNGGVYRITRQWPLRAGKGSYYEGGIREPMFIYWKGNIEAGSRSNIPLSNLDIYPSLLEVAGIELPGNKTLDGNSIFKLLEDEEAALKRPLFWHFPIYLEGGNIETQDKLFRTRPGSAVRLGDWKLIEYFEEGDLELYNLKDDIGEKHNLATKEPDVLLRLKELLDTWRQDVEAPVPSEINAEYIKFDEGSRDIVNNDD